MTAQLAADLRAVKAHLERRGWCQGAVTDVNGRHCLVGAYHGAVYAGDDGGGRQRAVRQTLFDVIPREYDSMAAWNDAPGRTVEEVYALLDEAIARVEKGGAK